MRRRERGRRRFPIGVVLVVNYCINTCDAGVYFGQ